MKKKSKNKLFIIHSKNELRSLIYLIYLFQAKLFFPRKSLSILVIGSQVPRAGGSEQSGGQAGQ